jgi:hypothetical protein
MSNKRSTFRELARDLLPHAAWDGIRTLLAFGIAVGLTAVIALLQWLRHHLDIVTIIGAFCASVLMLIVAMLLNDRNIRSASKKAQYETPFTEEFPTDFAVHLEKAKNAFLTGTHHSSAVTAYYHIFERKIRSGGTLKVLLLDPAGAAYKMAAMRFPGKVSAEQERIRIQSSLASLSELQKIAPERVEIRVIDFLVEYTAYLLDPDAESGVIYLERYTFKTSGGSRKPKFVYRKGDSAWFEHITTEFTHLWENAVPWKGADTASSQAL